MREDYHKLEEKAVQSSKQKKILIAPSWQEGNIVDTCLDLILDNLGNRGYQITVRPHPQHVRHRKEYMEQLKHRYADNTDIVIDSKLASRHHCIIQKIRDAYFLKDEGSTNGTFLNGRRIPPDKYVKLNAGDKLTIGSSNLIMG